MFDELKSNLQNLGYEVSVFDKKEEAREYLKVQIKNEAVGFGGSVTLDELGLYEALKENNEVIWHWRIPESSTDKEVRERAISSSIYLSSVNAVSEKGEIVNIDGMGNRVSATLYGHKKVYLILGKNKIEKDLDSAIKRARNIASPLNAKRLGVKTPCAVKGDKCYDCKSPERICRALCVLYEKPMKSDIEVIIINENLGY